MHFLITMPLLITSDNRNRIKFLNTDLIKLHGEIGAVSLYISSIATYCKEKIETLVRLESEKVMSVFGGRSVG